MELSNIISYFRECYEADNARATIWNIFHTNVEHRIFAEQEEQLLTGLLEHAPIDSEKGKAAATAAYLYRKEKELTYCSLFLVGRLQIEQDAEAQPICAPLLMHPAEIIEIDRNLFLRPDLDNLRLNYLLLDNLEARHDRHLSEELSERLHGGTSSVNFIPAVSQLLQDAVPGLDPTPLFQYPRLISERELREAFKSAGQDATAPPRLLPCSAVALVKKSVETRGVLNELLAIAQGDSVSNPLAMAFGNSRHNANTLSPAIGRVPAVLSSAQKQILRSARAAPLTLVIGPPGTGKSYTIAAVAMEHLGRGQSVLIASKMNHAVDVVGRKVEQQLGIQGCVVRAGRKQYLKDFKIYLEQLLSGIHTSGPPADREIAGLERDLRSLDRSVNRFERDITRYSTREVAWGRLLSAPSPGTIPKLIRSYIGWRVTRSTPLWIVLEQLERKLDERVRKTTRLIGLLNRRRLARALARHRAEFTTFLKALRARTGGKQEDLFNAIDFRTLLTAFPVWLVNLSDIHDVLPLKQDLFDLVIIDEATQCDVPSSLPALQRARRALIVGDPSQLRHLSFLSARRQKELVERWQVSPHQQDLCDYREKSILDLANETIRGQDRVIFLDEHFRSAPRIIQFSNETFYGNALHIMTEKPGEPVTTPLTLLHIKGRRGPEGDNAEEARLIVDDLASHVEREKALGPELSHSIGVLSPFRSQVELISKKLSTALPPDAFIKHDILIGTAHTFQGEERDLMFLSLVVDSASPAASLRFLEKRDVFNVSITRARIAQRVYVSLNPLTLGTQSLLGAYLRYIDRMAAAGRAVSEALKSRPDPFLLELKEALDSQGYETWPAYSIAGLVMDLIARRDGQSCGIDLIGYPGDYELAVSLEHYKMFHRAGLRIVPVPYSRWLADKQACLQAVARTVGTSRP